MRMWINLLAVAAVTACAPMGNTPGNNSTAHNEAAAATAALHAWLDGEFDRYLDFFPLSRSRLGDQRDNDRLGDASETGLLDVLEWRRQSVADMERRFARNNLDAEGKLSYDLWRYLLERQENSYRFRHQQFVVGRRGPHTGLPQALINFHSVTSAAELDAYLTRLKATDTYFEQYRQRILAAAQAGVTMPYFNYDTAIRQIDGILGGRPFTADAGKDTALWIDVQQKTAALLEQGTIDDGLAEAYLSAAREALTEHMQPGYERLRATLAAQRKRVTETAQGAANLPDGRAYYDWRLARMTTTDLSAEAIHELGLAEVARIHAEVQDIMTAVNFDGDLAEFFEFMRTDDRFYLPSTDAGRTAYLEQADEYVKQIEARLPNFFGLTPRSPLVVKRVEAYREQPGGAAHYSRPSLDGSRPGVFYAHLVDMRAVPVYALETLTYHEAIPGHHMQIALQQEQTDLPKFRGFHGYTAFSEGWALYAEALAKEMGFFTDPYNDFGRLAAELWRAIRLVVDTGIHAFGWSEQRAFDYALNNSSRPEASVKFEIRRYFDAPAQATAYKVGMLEIQRLKADAKARLGSAFTEAEFHDQVLGSGSLPMPMLAAKIDAWVSAAAR